MQLWRQLDVAIPESHLCSLCMDWFTAADGLACEALHFNCNGCLDKSVRSICQRPATELAMQPCLVPCISPGCGEGYAERQLVCSAFFSVVLHTHLAIISVASVCIGSSLVGLTFYKPKHTPLPLQVRHISGPAYQDYMTAKTRLTQHVNEHIVLLPMVDRG